MAVKELTTSRMCYSGEELPEELDGWQIDERVRWMLSATTLVDWLTSGSCVDAVIEGHDGKFLLPHEKTLNQHLRRNNQRPLIHRVSLHRESPKSIDRFVPDLPPTNASIHLRIQDRTHGVVRLCEDVDHPELLEDSDTE